MTKYQLPIIAALVAIGLGVSSTHALANPMKYGCDTASGRFSQIEIPIQATQFSISGTVTPALFRKDKDWIPSAVIRVENKENKNAMALRFTAKDSKAKAATITLELMNEGDERGGNAGEVALNETISYSLVYSRDGQSSITVNDAAYELTSNLGDSFHLSISCSTGDFIFDKMTWQTGD